MRLSDHFSLEEFIASDIAARSGIDNYPTARAYENLKMLAESAEAVRKVLGYPMHISSGYRCPSLNSMVGSRPTSAHVDGLAIDFTCPEFGTPLQVCREIASSKIPFDQVIHEFGSWCHFAIVQRGLIGRRELLTIDKKGTRMGLEAA
jgi:zinc D-Ala-D-Ala carboxypeptidase